MSRRVDAVQVFLVFPHYPEGGSHHKGVKFLPAPTRHVTHRRVVPSFVSRMVSIIHPDLCNLVVLEAPTDG